MKKQNIAILVGRISGSGPARVASNLSLYLSNTHYNKKVIIYYEEESRFEIDGELINLNTLPTKNPFKSLMNTFKRIRMLKKIKKNYNIDTTISLLPNPNLINILSRQKDKIIISERSFMSKELIGIHGMLYKVLYKIFYKKADEIIAVSEVVKLDLVQNFSIPKNKIKVIYNFYDIEKIIETSQDSIPENHKAIFNNPTIITAGRLSYQKGHWHLIRAFKEVKKEIPKAKLLILGVGELESYLKDLVRDLNITEDVYFLGFQSNPFRYIAKADLYAFPSLYEGFPNALAEAMACGLPVISTDCPSGPRELLSQTINTTDPIIKEIIQTDFGILIPTCDGELYNSDNNLTNEERLMAEAIVKLLSSEDLLISYKEKSLKRIKDFHKNKIIKEWESLLKSND